MSFFFQLRLLSGRIRQRALREPGAGRLRREDQAIAIQGGLVCRESRYLHFPASDLPCSCLQIFFNKDAGVCKVACTKNYDTSDNESKKKLGQLKRGMGMNYQHHWIVDNMPVTWCYPVESGQVRKITKLTFPLVWLQNTMKKPAKSYTLTKEAGQLPFLMVNTFPFCNVTAEILRHRLPHGLHGRQARQPQRRLRHFKVYFHLLYFALKTQAY